jgi:hypothetical protein
MPPPGPSPALFFDTVNAYQRTEALRAAVELDLFTHVATGRSTAAAIAEACGASVSSPITSQSSGSSAWPATSTSSPPTRPPS